MAASVFVALDKSHTANWKGKQRTFKRTQLRSQHPCNALRGFRTQTEIKDEVTDTDFLFRLTLWRKPVPQSGYKRKYEHNAKADAANKCCNIHRVLIWDKCTLILTCESQILSADNPACVHKLSQVSHPPCQSQACTQTQFSGTVAPLGQWRTANEIYAEPVSIETHSYIRFQGQHERVLGA